MTADALHLFDPDVYGPGRPAHNKRTTTREPTIALPRPAWVMLAHYKAGPLAHRLDSTVDPRTGRSLSWNPVDQVYRALCGRSGTPMSDVTGVVPACPRCHATLGF